jgi:structural maintenance of chromosome 1
MCRSSLKPDVCVQLCFGRSEKIKAVTLDGAVISKAGTMTGGNSSRDAGSGSRWDDQAASDLKQRRDKIFGELGKLETGHRDKALIADLQSKGIQLKTKEQYALKDSQLTMEKMEGVKKQVQELKKQVSDCVHEKQKLLPAAAEREAALKAVQERIAETEDKTFNTFSRSIGVANIRDFEEGHLRALQESSSGRRDIREQKAKLEAQLQYERTKDFKTPLSNIEKRLAVTKGRISDGEARQKQLAKEEKLTRARLRAAEDARDEARNALDEKEIEVKTLQDERSACSKERSTFTKRITAEEVKVEQLRGKLHTLLQKAKVEEVDLPMVGGGSGGGGGGGSSQRDGSETASQQSEATGSTHFSQTQNTAVRQDRADAERIDFSKLTRHRDAAPTQVEAIKKEFEAKIADLRGEIEQMQPNMKASERFEDVSTMHKSSAERFDQAREQASTATHLFNEVKQKRHDAFMGCYNHISQELQAIYCDLTKSSKHPLGGNAYLSLDDTEDPFLGGIKYNAMPPMKRFRDMDQLSGGEKTVASLALLFAIHSFRPAPFFVMDEVDAALDNVNVKKVLPLGAQFFDNS